VEILTSKSHHVQPSWIGFVTTAKAKAKIEALLRRANRDIQKKGEEKLEAWLAKYDIELSTAIIDRLCKMYDVKRREDLYQGIGDNVIILSEKNIDEVKGKKKKSDNSGGGWRKYVPFVKAKNEADEEEKKEGESELFIVPEKFNRKKPIYISETNIHQYIFPKCCSPIPGDDALGYIDNNNCIELHKRTCPVANKLKASFGNRILDVKWDMHKILFFDATIRLGGIDRRGLVNEVTRVISNQLSVDIRKLTFTTEDGIFDGIIDLRVHDRNDVSKIIENLKGIEDLKEISQIL
jgi:GTP pyrophosphokinase